MRGLGIRTNRMDAACRVLAAKSSEVPRLRRKCTKAMRKGKGRQKMGGPAKDFNSLRA